MSTQITAPTAPDMGVQQRISYMTALSLAEMIISESTVMPASFVIEVVEHRPTKPAIRFYFHQDPAAVREFADERWMDVTAETRDDGSVYTEARGGLCRGVLVTAWTLMPAEAIVAVADEVAA
ncbi:hypothetical protein OOK13_40445 [Streptomyces sp. NBC_00378]|uniref:hypothetical protein n=1 Tax=unclassified Streptomyces TaxID=2593676 RepID=UPI0022557F1C|nr:MULTISPECIES: hypothetical protein [unclassified Streptomyces]MCX5112172.1 hypothetical protein [Streptomyces sp. NBC_00378]MCX5114633.1 hypothetical protein [Streptomyces sp. NBC_00378]